MAGWRKRPVFWICVIVGTAAVAGYMTRPEGRREDGILRSSLRTTPDGLAALSRGIARMGRHTEPRLTPMAGADPVRGTIATLQGRSFLSPREVEAVLENVRRGGTFIYAPPVQEGGDPPTPIVTPLLIALGFWFGESSIMPGLQERDWLARRLDETRFGEVPSARAEWTGHPLADGLPPPVLPRFGFVAIPETEAGPVEADSADPSRGDAAPEDPADAEGGEEQEDESGPPELPAGWPDVTDAGPAETVLTVSLDDGEELIVVAVVPLGAGRIVLFADAAPFANEAAGDDPLAVLAVRAALAYTSEADTVFFDEFRQGITGYGSRAEVLAGFFLESPGGRTLLHAVIAGFLVLACRGLRFGVPTTAVAPSDRERRSPLEHVSALGDLYRKAGAANTAALLLLSRLASSIRRPAPRDVEEADTLLRELESRGGGHPSLDRVRAGLRAEPMDLTMITAGVDEHLSRRPGK